MPRWGRCYYKCPHCMARCSRLVCLAWFINSWALYANPWSTLNDFSSLTSQISGYTTKCAEGSLWGIDSTDRQRKHVSTWYPTRPVIYLHVCSIHSWYSVKGQPRSLYHNPTTFSHGTHITYSSWIIMLFICFWSYNLDEIILAVVFNTEPRLKAR